MTTVDKRPNWRVVISVMVLTVVLASVGVAASSTPATCALCHSEQSAALDESPHRRVACYECHLPTGRWSFAEAKLDEIVSMYPKQLLGRGLRDAGDRISRSACVRCHADSLAGVISDNGLRISHADCSPPPDKCDGCHTDAAHGTAVRWRREADMDVCTACHSERDAPLHCQACHSGKAPSDVQKAGNLKVTHGSDWERTHGMADLRTCITCHEQSDCVRCHGTVIPHPESFLATHGDEALLTEARCASCHTEQSMCNYCHGMTMPHPTGFKREHTEVAKSRTDAVCLRCHSDLDCLNCHTGHAHPGTTHGTLGGTPLPQVESH